MLDPDADLEGMSAEALRAETRRLRAGIRAHRAATGHALCWYVPELWGLLPEKPSPAPSVPERSEFLACCAQYRDSLDAQATFEGYCKSRESTAKALGPWQKHRHSYACDCAMYPVSSGFHGEWWYRPDHAGEETEHYAFTEADRATADATALNNGYVLFDK
jgi:hypothetical protein